MTKIDALKAASKLVVSIGVGAIVSNAVTFTTPVLAMGLLKRAAVGVGSFVLSCMVSEKACDYTDEKIDAAVVELQKMSEEDLDKKA